MKRGVVEEFAGHTFPAAERLVLRDESDEVFGVAGAEVESSGVCPQNGMIAPADALLAFQHFLGIADPLLDTCRQDHANVLDPLGTGITPADALCIFQKFIGLPSCLG